VCEGFRGISVSRVTRLRTGWPWVQFAAGGKEGTFCIFAIASRPALRAHSASYPTGTGGLFAWG